MLRVDLYKIEQTLIRQIRCKITRLLSMGNMSFHRGENVVSFASIPYSLR
ncbi:hypothetical protein Hanom_Chr12g01129011 [Helianthus anomalus]